MAPSTGLEPVTYGLTVRRSTDWTTREWADDITQVEGAGQGVNLMQISFAEKTTAML